MVTPEQVWLDNIRDHQIGGQTDGISREVAEDLGFHPPKREVELGSAAVRKTVHKKTYRSKKKPVSKRTQKLHDAIDERIRRNADPWGPDLGAI